MSLDTPIYFIYWKLHRLPIFCEMLLYASLLDCRFCRLPAIMALLHDYCTHQQLFSAFKSLKSKQLLGEISLFLHVLLQFGFYVKNNFFCLKKFLIMFNILRTFSEHFIQTWWICWRFFSGRRYLQSAIVTRTCTKASQANLHLEFLTTNF